MKKGVQLIHEVVQTHTYRKTDREVDTIDGYTKGGNFLQLLHVDYLAMPTISMTIPKCFKLQLIHSSKIEMILLDSYTPRHVEATQSFTH